MAPYQSRVVLLTLTLLLASSIGFAQTPPHGHSHNDYHQNSPLHDALAAGFDSVEADVFVVYAGQPSEQLRVAHVASEWSADRTLESLYLDPLVALGSNHPPSLRLEVESKVSGAPSNKWVQVPAIYEHVKTAMAARPSLHSWVTVTFIGQQYYSPDFTPPSNIPSYLKFRAAPNAGFAFLTSWPYTWTGNGPMPPSERAALEALVTSAHSAGKWFMVPTYNIEATAFDIIAVWDELDELLEETDRVSTDDPALFDAWRQTKLIEPPDAGADAAMCLCPCP